MTTSAALSRRGFLALLGIGVLTACNSELAISPQQDTRLLKVIHEKQELVEQANTLIRTKPKYIGALTVVVTQNLVQISALEAHLPTPEPSQSAIQINEIDISALAKKCLTLSKQHLKLACQISDSELSRTLAQIAASETQHQMLLNESAS